MTSLVTTGEDLKKNAICVIINVSRFATKRTVSKDDAKVESTEKQEGTPEQEVNLEIDQDQTSIAKELLDSKELRAIQSYDEHTKAWFKKRSVKSPLLRSGAYIFAAEALPTMYEYLEGRAEGRKPLIADFKKALPGLIEQAKKDLGPLWNSSDYPSADNNYSAVDSLFSFGWSVVEVSTPDKKLRAVSQAIYQKEKDKAERVWQNAVGQINEALAVGMAEVVKHLSDRLGGGDEPPKRFQARSIAKVMEFLDTFQQRNLSGNADLNKLVEDARNLLNGVDVKDLKSKDNATVRKSVVAGFAEIKKSLDTMLENKPSRAIALATDEAV